MAQSHQAINLPRDKGRGGLSTDLRPKFRRLLALSQADSDPDESEAQQPREKIISTYT